MKLFVKIFYVYAALFYSKGCSLWAIGAITSYGPQPNRSRSMTVYKVSRLGQDQRPNPYRSRSRGNGRRSKLSEDNHDSKRKKSVYGHIQSVWRQTVCGQYSKTRSRSHSLRSRIRAGPLEIHPT